MIIRPEVETDAEAIDVITAAAFATVPYGTAHDSKITGMLRDSGDLNLSLVACDGETLLGHVAFSPVRVGDEADGWYCLGPVSVRPDHYSRGIGSELIREGLSRLKDRNARGCILMGNPAYYARFGFEVSPGLLLNGEASRFLQVLGFAGETPEGEVVFNKAFDDPEA